MGCIQSGPQDNPFPHDGPSRRISALPGRWTSPAPLTAPDLDRRRQAFWDTSSAQGGHPQMWQNLRLVCEALLVGDMDLANTILESTGCALPQANLAVAQNLLVYDATGALCALIVFALRLAPASPAKLPSLNSPPLHPSADDLPIWTWSTPANVISVEEANRLSAARRKESRVLAAPLSLRVRVAPTASSREQDIPLTGLSTSTPVDEFKAKLHEALLSGKFDQTGDAANKQPNVWGGARGGLPPPRQRLMYRGRELVDGSLGQGGVVEDGAILQVFVKGAYAT